MRVCRVGKVPTSPTEALAVRVLHCVEILLMYLVLMALAVHRTGSPVPHLFMPVADSASPAGRVAAQQASATPAQ